MKGIVDIFKASGADQDTMNFLLKALAIFVMFLGGGSLISAVVLQAIGQTPPIWLVGIITTVAGVVLSLLTASHQTTVINGTAAQTATAAASTQTTIIQQAKDVSDANAQTIASIMRIVENLSATNATVGPLAVKDVLHVDNAEVDVKVGGGIPVDSVKQ
jgi:hypothetical protein